MLLGKPPTKEKLLELTWKNVNSGMLSRRPVRGKLPPFLVASFAPFRSSPATARC